MSDRAKTALRSSIAFLILLAPNLYAACTASDLASPAKTTAYLIVAGIGLIIPMLLLRRRSYFLMVGILFLFCSPIEIASLYLNHNPATATFVGLIYATNWREAVGVMGAVWPLITGWFMVWVLYFILVCRQPNEWMIPRRIGLWTVGIGLPLLFTGGLVYFSIYARNIYNLHNPGEVVSMAKELTLMKFKKIYPYNIYINTYHVVSEQRAIRQTQQELVSFRFGIEPKQDSTPEMYLLVIGEAARSGNLGLNGYTRNTTPRLSRRDNLLSFPHIYAQAGITEQSVPHMLSRIPVSRHDEVYTEKTLPEAFQEAGFQTAWLTNKSRAFYIQRVLDSMDKCFETGKDLSTSNNYDTYLLPPLQNVLTDKGKQFIVLHTMGSHWRFDTRYPAEFEQFTPALGEDFTLNMIRPTNKERLVNAYDNTILYTDFFLDSLISTVEQQALPAVVVYMSDHGENLYDDERQLILHGNYSASHWLFHVPLLIWYSDEYAALHPDKVANLQSHVESTDNSTLLFPSMLDAAGLTYINDTASNAIIRTRSIFSSSYCAPDTLFVLTAEGECIVLDEF